MFRFLKKATGEIRRSLSIIASPSKEIIAEFKNSNKSENLRRDRPYSFRPEGTPKEFRKEFLMLRVTVSIYLAVFIGCASIAGLGVYDHIQQMTEFMFVISMIGLLQYIKHIRDVFRARKISMDWDLRNDPLAMSWKSFFREVLENPLRLIPLF